MTVPRKRLGALTAALVACALMGCGGQVIDASRVQEAMAEELERALNINVAWVDCPADVSAKPRERFQCQVNPAGAGDMLTAEVKVVNAGGELEVIDVHN